MTLSIVIVSYNTKALLFNCLDSLYTSINASQIAKETEVIVVDNRSSDKTVEAVKAKYRNVSIIENNENLGFGRANNKGIQKSKGKYILLLNSDTVLFPDTISKSFEYIQKGVHDVVGVKLLNNDKTVQQSAGYFPTPIRVFFWMFYLDSLPVFKSFVKPYHIKKSSFYTNSHDVDWVTGAYFLARKEVFEDTLFDPKVFMYVEEVELCFRIKKKGNTIGYYSNASLIHLKGGSSTAGADSGITQELEGIEYYYKKHYSAITYYCIKLILYTGALLRLIIFAIITPSEKRKEHYKKYLKLG